MSTRTRKPRSLTRSRAQRLGKQLEALESRVLMTATVTGFTPPGFLSRSGTYDGGGNLWFSNEAPDPNTGNPVQTLVEIGTGTANAGTIINTIDISGAANPDQNFAAPVLPTSLVYNPANHHLYFIDTNYSAASYLTNGDGGSIVEVDPNYIADNLASPIVDVHTLPEDGPPRTWSESPFQLTVSGDGSVWFATAGNSGSVNDNNTFANVVVAIGRLDLSDNITFQTFPSVSDATLISISANGPDSVWVGMRAIITEAGDPSVGVFGQNHIGTAHWDGSQIVADNVYNLNVTGVIDSNGAASAFNDSAAPTGVLTSVATDPTDNSVWFTLASTDGFGPDLRSSAQIPPDQVINGILNATTGNLDQTAYLTNGTDNSSANQLGAQGVAVDGTGTVWYVENNFQSPGTNVDTLDPSTGITTRLPLSSTSPAFSMTSPIAVVPSSDGTQAWVVNGFLGTGDPLVEVSNPASQITFAGTGSTITGAQELVSLGDEVLIAQFTAPPGNYTASIDWGDSTTPTVVTAGSAGSDMFAVYASGKIYSAQGDYTGHVTVSSGNTTFPAIPFSVNVVETPLAVLSVSILPLNGKSVQVQTTFSDGVDLTASNFSATINWGDGSTSAGLIQGTSQAGVFLVVGVHKYKKKGVYNVLTTIHTTELDAVIISNTSTTTATVGNA